MKFTVFFLSCFCFWSVAFALPAPEEYAIDTNEKIPDISALKKQRDKQNSLYDRHFSFRWDMPEKFDTEFKNIYQGLASDERHLSTKTEDEIYKMLQVLPKEYYPYIGPYLHTLPQLSGRILDMPGIKETKNKFPERIAERYKDVENIEYLSPSLYFLLMPETVGEGSSSYEFKQFEVPEYFSVKKVNLNPEFLQKIAAKTPLSDYANAPKKEKSAGIRHYVFDENTPLSGADVQAFSNTLSDLEDFNFQNKLELVKTNLLITYWEDQTGNKKDFYFYKQMANPCAAMVRNIKWSNKVLEFQKIIGKNGFGIDDWAGVCDRTLKAYRRADISLAMMIQIRGLKSGDALMKYYRASMDSEIYEMFENMMGAAQEMYNAKKEDVETVKPYMKRLYKTIPETASYFLGAPLIIP